jgi:hypothetical protein
VLSCQTGGIADELAIGRLVQGSDVPAGMVWLSGLPRLDMA